MRILARHKADWIASFEIERFDRERHDRSAFSSGFKPIDNFFRNSLTKNTAKGLLVAYVAVVDNDVVGFYTLSAHSVQPDNVKTLLGRTRSPSVPVWYMKAIAVDEHWQSRGIGNKLMVDALRRSANLSEIAGAAAIVLDVLNDGDAARRRIFL